MYCSIDCKYEYFFVQRATTTSNVFFSNPFFKLADGLIWNLEEIFTGCTFVAWTTGFQNLIFFSIFFITQKTRGTRKIDILTSKYCHCFNFWNFAGFCGSCDSRIKMHFDFLVSNNQVDWNHVSHSYPFIISTTFIDFVKKKIANTLQVWINLCAKTAY